jgi:hypothetical protein
MNTFWNKFAPRTWNDILSVFVLGLITALWILHGRGTIVLEKEIIGATTVTFALVVQFYFRKAQGESKNEG